MLMFIDAFGLCQNIYRLKLGWYFIPAGLTPKEWGNFNNVQAKEYFKYNATRSQVEELMTPLIPEVNKEILNVLLSF